MNELIKKLRRYELKIRKRVNSHRAGEFRSVFKGSGLEHDAVRTYQYGDDVRRIDWNVSAKGHGTFVKTFKEDKAQTIFFVLDLSGSLSVGLPQKQKVDCAKEVLGTLALSALKDGHYVGFLGFTDQKEIVYRPKRDMNQAYGLLTSIFTSR